MLREGKRREKYHCETVREQEEQRTGVLHTVIPWRLLFVRVGVWRPAEGL